VSSIFGFAWLDGRPASRDTADRMAAAAGAFGPDGMALWHGEHAVLGRALMRRTPEDAFDRMPIVDADRGITIVAAGRLDNRDEKSDAWSLIE
jgi:asparagine synthetase B (glutamine-hydrolysing)